MITAITFHWIRNKKYDAPEHVIDRLYGQRTTIDLENSLRNDIAHFSKALAIVTDLNKDLDNAIIGEIIFKHANQVAWVTPKTKKKRTYYWGGLTIHEEDK